MWRPGKVLVLVAHQDDETLACGGRMIEWPDCVIAHVTNGSPADLSFARAAGFRNQSDYAEARWRELECALALAGGRTTRRFGLADQQASDDLAGLTRRVTELIAETRPSTIVTHPYEGGHPDHDGTAFAAQHACALLGATAPERVEAAFYNRYGGVFRPGEFLPGPAAEEVELDAETRLRKDRMFACFTSQRPILSHFSTRFERFRPAPRYDFSQAPHAGPLNYEEWGWELTGEKWRESAARARRALSR